MENNQIDIADLKKRVWQFQLMELPGQMDAMHIGTCYLVHDLWLAVEYLSKRYTP